MNRNFETRSSGTLISARIFVALSASLLGVSAGFCGGAAATEVQTAALTPGTEMLREADLPEPLSFDDADRYRRIFALQAAGKWVPADREIQALGDRQLLGSVLAQRYLSRNYRAKYSDLAAWLAAYHDQPDAKAIYALAMKRKPDAAALPARPAAPQGMGNDIVEARAGDAAEDGKPQGATLRRRVDALIDEIKSDAQADPRQAELLLGGSEAKKLLGDNEIDELRARIAEGYLAAGETQQALAVGAVTRNSAYAPLARWHAGLAAWRLGRLEEARGHFQAVARAHGQSEWMISAAAFWAARVELRSRRPELVNYWLGMAAEYPRTFYGLLARRTLGVDTYFDFDIDPFTESDARILMGVAVARRALALLQVGERWRAEAELRAMAGRATPPLADALIALADRANMPALSLQLGMLLGDGDGRHHDHALFPVPRWTPQGGFTVDRAFLFALMRQESQFLPNVKSSAGALGLMQLMPATARSMAQRRGLALHAGDRQQLRESLAEPEINIALAQEYITALTQDDHIKDNLVLLAAAYNCGPGPLPRWQSDPALREDPLLFIESIPLQQTRFYTVHVLANYWIYRQRLGQPTPDLDALAAGQWPTYTAQDASPEQDSRHAENR